MAIAARTDLHLVIVGGGATGVELAAELSHYMETLSRYATDEMPTHLRMTLIETGPRLLGPFPKRISKSVEAKLRQLGIDVRTNKKVVAADRRRLSRSSMVWKSTTADRSWSGLRYRARRTTACSRSAIAQAFRAWTEGLFQRLPKWLDNRPSSLHRVLSDISGKTVRLPNSISATWGASCRWPTTLPTAHSAPTAFSAEDSLGGTWLILRTQRSIGCTRWISMVPSGAVSLGLPTTCIAPFARVSTSADSTWLRSFTA